MKHVMWSDGESIVALCLASLGGLATCFTMVVFIKYNHTPVVKVIIILYLWMHNMYFQFDDTYGACLSQLQCQPLHQNLLLGRYSYQDIRVSSRGHIFMQNIITRILCSSKIYHTHTKHHHITTLSINHTLTHAPKDNPSPFSLFSSMFDAPISCFPTDPSPPSSRPGLDARTLLHHLRRHDGLVLRDHPSPCPSFSPFLRRVPHPSRPLFLDDLRRPGHQDEPHRQDSGRE